MQRIYILVLSTRNEEYRDFEIAIRNSWAKDFTNKGIKVLFYKGGFTANEIVGDELRLAVEDDLGHTYKKFFAAINYLRDVIQDEDLIFRTNLSSYLDIDGFIKYISLAEGDLLYDGYYGIANKYSERFYGLPIIHLLLKYLNIGQSIPFLSGSGFFISGGYAKKLRIPDRKPFIDDVEIGYQLGVAKRSGYQRVLIDDKFQKLTIRRLNEMEKAGLFHYKFKTSDRNLDAHLIESFANRILRRKTLTND